MKSCPLLCRSEGNTAQAKQRGVLLLFPPSCPPESSGHSGDRLRGTWGPQGCGCASGTDPAGETSRRRRQIFNIKISHQDTPRAVPEGHAQDRAALRALHAEQGLEGLSRPGVTKPGRDPLGDTEQHTMPHLLRGSACTTAASALFPACLQRSCPSSSRLRLSPASFPVPGKRGDRPPPAQPRARPLRTGRPTLSAQNR